MSISVPALLILLALDGPVGQGIPPVIARFGGDNILAIPAVFARYPAESMPRAEIVWFLDGDALAVPVGKSSFLYARTPAENPVLTHGSFSLDLPASDKTETYRGVLYQAAEGEKSEPLARIQLAVFPPDAFVRDWKALAETEVSITLIGELPGMREFLDTQGVRFVEGDLQDSGTVDRNGMLVVDAGGKENFIIPPGLARAMLIFAAPDRSWQSRFGVRQNGDALIWTQRPPHLDFTQDPLAQAQFLQLAQPLIPKQP